MSETVAWDAPLVRSARKWIAESLSGWADKDYPKVVALAPMAVEHLAKAALWHKSPALLAILDKSHQASFIALLTKPVLENPDLRTIGLSDSLGRVCDVYEATLPLSAKRKSRLIAARGGALHVGHADTATARFVLADALTLFVWLADLLDIGADFLFGINSTTANRLLDERRSEKQIELDQRLAASGARMSRLAQSVGGELLHDTTSQKEALTMSVLPSMIQTECVGTMRQCPACHHDGAILGELELDPLVEVEYTRDGPATYSGYDYYLIPDAFFCNVCLFAAHDVEELKLVDLPNERFILTDDELTDELLDYAQAAEDQLREQYGDIYEYAPPDL
jgi:hypothetical protein